MTENLPIITFDTSAHNRLVDDGARSQPVIAGMRAGFFFRFAGLSIEELISTSDRIKGLRSLLRAQAFNQMRQIASILKTN